MKKLQQYYILKFSSSRLRKAGNNITISLNEARSNDEVVSLGDSQILRTVRKVTGKYVNQELIEELFKEKKRLKRRRDSSENRTKLIEVENKIDDLLFIHDIISITVDDNRHYEKIINNGVYINEKKFVRLLCGAGNARRNTVIFINAEIEEEVKRIINNGRNGKPLVDAKFNAYFALANSATLEISTPKFCVVPDYEINRIRRVEFVDESQVIDKVEERDMELPFNLWDGMGIVSPAQAQQWAEELDLGYLPSAFCIRGSFLKGMVCTFDFHRFASEIAHNFKITDVWGNTVDVNDVEVIITASQLKLWNCYDNAKHYIDSCAENGLLWGISRVTPKADKTTCFSNYQYVQVLNLDDKQIENLCSNTVEYIEKVSGGDIRYTLLYLLGEMCNNTSLTGNWCDTIDDPVAKALVINNDLINDPFVRRHIINSLNKKIKESYIGNLILEGNYQVMISDPFAFCEYLFGQPVKGLLEEGQCYSHFWNDRRVNKVAGMRSPLTWRSEVNVLSLKDDAQTEDWYRYITSGIIYNVHGLDTMIHADSDWDFDIVCTTSNQEFINGAFGGLPITYAKKSAPKKVTVESELYKADEKSFNSKIGFITNCSTTLYSMLPLFPEDSREYAEIIDRLKICRKEQGNQIDKAKGIVVKAFPEYWTKRQKITDEMTEEEKEIAKFNNSLVIDKRPYFMRYLYDDYDKQFKRLKDRYDPRASAISATDLDGILNKPERTEDELKLLQELYHDSRLLDSPSIMNKVCHFMSGRMKEIRYKDPEEFNYQVLIDRNIPIDDDKVSMMVNLYKKYKIFKQEHSKKGYQQKSNTLDQFVDLMKLDAYKISSDISELANLAVYVCYGLFPNGNKDFAWKLFDDGMIRNIINNSTGTTFIPLLAEDGDIQYLGKRYRWTEINF